MAINESVNLKVNADVSNTINKMELIIAQFNALSSTVNDGLNKPFKLTEEELNNIDNLLKHLSINLVGLSGDINESTWAHLKKEIDSVSESISILHSKKIENNQVSVVGNTSDVNVVQNTIDLITAQFNALSTAVNEGLANPLKMTEEELDNIKNLLSHLSNNTMSLESLVSDWQFEKSIELVEDLKNKIDELSKMDNTSVQKTFIYTDEVNSLNALNSTLNDVTTTYEKTDSAQSKFFVGADGLIHKYSELNNSLNTTANTQNNYYMGVDGLIHRTDELSNSQNNLSNYTDRVSGAINELNASADDWAESIGRIANATDNTSETTEDLDKDFEVLKEALGSGKDIVGQFASHLGINSSKVEEFTTILGKLSPEGQAACIGLVAIIGTLKILSKEADEAIETFKNFAVDTLKDMPELFSDIASNGIDLFVDSLSNMKDMIDTAIESMQELSEIGIDANSALFIMNNYLGNEGASNLHEYISALGELKGINVVGTEASLKGLYGSLSNMDLDADSLDKYAKTFVNFMNDLSVYQGTTVEAIGGQLENALSFGILNSRSALAKALDITDEMIDQFKELSSVEERAQWILGRWPIFAGKYNEWMETDQGKVTMLKNSWENLMSTIGQLALKVYAMVAPLLTQILNLANSVLGGIYSLFNIDANNDVSSAVSGYSGLADSIEEVGKAAEKAQRKTASFDDVIQISDSGSSSDMSSAIGQAVDMASILDEINSLTEDGESLWSKYSDAINKAISLGDWKEAGRLISQFMYEWLDQIDWNNINQTVGSFGHNLGKLFNGLSGNKGAWLKVGETIGKSFNAITLGIKSFFSTFDGYDFGDSLGTMWKNMWDTFDEQQAADALYEVFNDVFETVAGFLGQGGFMSTAESVSKTITGFFGGIAEGGNTGYYANTMYDLAKNIFLSFANAIYEVVTDDNTKSTVRDAIGVLFMDLADDADNLANNLVTLVTGILEFVGDALINPVNINFILNAIGTFIDTVADNKDKIIESLSPIINTLTDGLEKLVKSGKIAEVFNLIFDILAESGVFDLIAEWMNVQMQIKFNMFMLGLKSKIMVLTSYLVDGALDVLEAVANGIKIGAGFIVAAFYTAIVQPFTKLWDSLSAVLGELWTSFKTWWNTHFGGKSLIDITIPNWIPVVGGKTWDFKIPALATGGIVTRSTIANIGEAGAEAVLPLERNTQWMDNLANKIASRMGNSNNAVTIDLSKCQKPFYTRSEMLETGEYIGQCLKLAGMNVSIVM